ncbi:heme ABC transporter ATP-binding protein [Aliivibrio kagoshimensis]|uniref:heme ABC transporter ATP-binding protein n=1 Tax=Aliivibrio kagoshimensis TaxID=2910230 RepID=UPI003D0C415B
MPLAISAKNLQLELGGRTLLDGVDLDLYSGEVTALLGPNGAGKSSLLKILCKEHSCSSDKGASLGFFGDDESNWSRADLAMHLGVLPQHSNLTFSFTVREVVELGLMPLQLQNINSSDLVEEMMNKTGVEHLADRLFPTLSGGEKQRVHFSRVLTQISQAGDKQILMLDEPTSALDLAHQHTTLSIARERAQAGAAVIVVLHDLNLAAQYADRLVVLNSGTIQADGTPWSALTALMLEQVYGQQTLVAKHPKHDYPVVYAI